MNVAMGVSDRPRGGAKCTARRSIRGRNEWSLYQQANRNNKQFEIDGCRIEYIEECLPFAVWVSGGGQ